MAPKDIGTILCQLQTDLIEMVRVASPPRCQTCRSLSYSASAESSVESAIRRCVNNALKRWAPEFKTNSSSDAETSSPLVADFPDRYQYPLLEATTNFPSTSSEILSTSSEVSNTSSEICNRESYMSRHLDPRSGGLLGSINSPSSEPSNIRPTTSLNIGRVETSDRGKRLYWEKQKDILYRLYVEEDKPLPVVMEIMKGYGFCPTVKQYRYQLGEKWGWKKYNASALHQRPIKTTDKERVEDIIPFPRGWNEDFYHTSYKSMNLAEMWGSDHM
ncbi:hypothetical protein F5B21DRAFT_436039 [Xylaria acuta]|nr:hypothetical protein F5B21DRAFT_436039 [Xylaria acuta]